MKKPTIKGSLDAYKKTRFGADTPKFFKVVRNIGIVCGVLGAAIATAPVSLPAGLVAAGGYLAWIGGTAATVSQFAKSE